MSAARGVLILRGCPFCAGTKISLTEHKTDELRAFCHNCKAHGPPGSTRYQAVRLWNRRPHDMAYHDDASGREEV